MNSGNNNHQAKRREEILAAAGKVFDEYGYAATTMDAIAEAAGLSKGSLYNYFTGKEDLFEQVFLSFMGSSGDEVERLISGEPSARAKLERIFDFWAQDLETIKSISRLTLEFWATAAREKQGQIAAMFAELYDHWRRRLGGIIADGIDRCEFIPQIDPSISASLIMAILDGLKLQAVFDAGVDVDAKFMAALKRNMIAGLATKADPSRPAQDKKSDEVE